MATHKFSRRRTFTVGFIFAVAIFVLTGGVVSRSGRSALHTASAAAVACPAVQPLLLMPFNDATSHKCTQGAGGSTSHNLNSTRHDLDFDDLGGAEEVVASAPGIAYLHNDGSGGFGLHINIKHDDTYFTLYGHLSAFRVQNGQFVERGQVIGLTGCTGTCLGEHLHWGLHTGNPQVTASSSTSVPAENILTSDATVNEMTYRLYRSDEFVGGIPSGHLYRSNNKRCSGGYSEGYRTQSCEVPVHPEGSLIRTRSDPNGTVYVLRRNDAHMSALHRDGIPTEQTLWTLYQNGGLGLQDVIVVEDAEMSSYPPGGTICQSGCTLQSPLPGNGRSEPPGRLISNGTEVSIVQSDGGRRPFSSQMTFSRMGYLYCNVKTVADYNSYLPVGQIVDGTSEDFGGAADELGPGLSITSHTDGQTLTSSTVTISGTASDAGRGESGVASVTVNGVRASGDTAAASATAHWSRTLTLSPGANTVSVVATDNSPAQNQTPQTITLNLSGGGGGGTTLATGLSNPTDVATDGLEVFWTDFGSSSVKKVSVGGGAVTTLFSGLFNPNAVAVDGSYVYFGYGKEVRRVAKGGGPSTTLATSPSTVTRIALTPTHVFWTDYNDGSVSRAPIDGGAREPLATGLSSPAGLVVGGGSVFWSEQTHPGAIRKVGTSGGSVTTLAAGSNTPGVDADSSYVYWTENNFINAGKVRKIPVNGGAETILADGLNYPHDLVRDATRVFWVENNQSGAVKQVPVGGGSPITLAGSLAEPVAIAADNDYIYWVERNGGGTGSGTLKRVAKQAVAPVVNVAVSPTALTYGTVDVNQSSDLSVTITNPSSSTGVLSGSVGSASAPFAVVGGGGSFSLSPGQSKAVVVRFSPTTAGSFNGSLAVTHNASNQASPVNISLSGAGAPAVGGGTWQVVNTLHLTGADYARHIAISGNRAYVTRSGAKMTVLDLDTGTEVGHVPFAAYPSSGPGYVAVSGNRAYVALSNLAPNGQLAAVDTSTLSVAGYFAAGVEPWGVAAFNGRVYVTNNVWWSNGDPATVRVLEPSNGSTVSNVPVGINPNCIAIDAVTGKAYVTNGNSLSNSVSVVNTATNAVVATVPMPNPPMGVATVNGRAYVSTGVNWPNGTVEVIDIQSDTIVASIPVGRDSVGVAASPRYVFVANQTSNTVSVIDTTTNTVVATPAVGRSPTGIAYNPSNGAVYVTNQLDATISVLKQVAPRYNISGRVMDGGVGLSGVSLSLTGSQSATAQTDANGYYSLDALAAGGNYSLSASLQGYTFTPSSRSYTNLGGNQTAQDFSGTSVAGLQYYPLARPVRLLDTRPGASACFTPGATLAANAPRTQPAVGTCQGLSIPSTARAIVGNATVVSPVSGGHLTLYSSDAALPTASNLNYVAGQVVPNAFTVGLSAAGSFNIFTPAQTHFIVDVAGYYAPPGTGGLYYHPLPQPVRLLDTRVGASACDAPGAPLQANASRTETARTTCNGVIIPNDARALVGNATVVNTGTGASNGHIILYPNGAPQPVISNLNYVAGQIVPNAFTVALGADGEFNVYAYTSTHIIVDVTGYYSASAAPDANGMAGLLFYPLAAPARLLDTRAGTTACYTPAAPLAANSVRTQPAQVTCSGSTVPASALAIFGNATVVSPGAAGHIILYPNGQPRPVASNLNYVAGQIIPNAFNVRLGAGGAFDIYTPTTTDFIIDMSGYFAP